MSETDRLAAILPLMACPTCRNPLRLDGQALQCAECAVKYPLYHGRPAFLPDGAEPRLMSPEHVSNQPPASVFDWLVWQKGWVLNLGAGGTVSKLDHVVEVEYSYFRNTDVAADAHRLPFGNNVFDAVVTFNTFEHLYDPNQAASEVYRVLKPGGRLILHTAFLQPVHEAPHHYYNTTEYGLRRWFRDFDIREVSVSENFNPAHVFAWLASEVLRETAHAEGQEARQKLASSTLESWASLWENGTLRASNPLWQMLGRLPQDVQKRFAAGFQLDAVKPT